MKNLWINLLVVLSIALQSFTAMANAGDIHQIDIKHIQTEHSHAVDDIAVVTEANADEHNSKDCHHCGHCHGTHSQWIVDKTLAQSAPKSLVSNQYYYLVRLDKRFIDALIRPPIA